MVQSFDEPSTSDHCILDLPPTECCCPPGLNIGGCGPGILHWFCSTMHHRTSLLLVVTLQIYLNTFIVYSNNKQPGFQHFNRGFVGFDFPHQDIKYISNFLLDAPRLKMHNCIAGESIISCIRLILNWMLDKEARPTWQKRRNKEILQDVTLIWLDILSSFNLQLY